MASLCVSHLSSVFLVEAGLSLDDWRTQNQKLECSLPKCPAWDILEETFSFFLLTHVTFSVLVKEFALALPHDRLQHSCFSISRITLDLHPCADVQYCLCYGGHFRFVYCFLSVLLSNSSFLFLRARSSSAHKQKYLLVPFILPLLHITQYVYSLSCTSLRATMHKTFHSVKHTETLVSNCLALFALESFLMKNRIEGGRAPIADPYGNLLRAGAPPNFVSETWKW